MQQIEVSICKLYGITYEQLKVNVPEEQCGLYLKQFEQGIYTLSGIPIKFMVNSNG